VESDLSEKQGREIRAADPETDEDTLEPWEHWIRRATRQVEEELGKAGIEDWVCAYRRRKWRFAGYTAQDQENKWSLQTLRWAEDRRQDLQTGGRGRKRGRPKTRWADEIAAYVDNLFGTGKKNDWLSIASEAPSWKLMEADFVQGKWKAALAPMHRL